MKTLAVSLHRLGDLIMHAHILKAFKEETGHSISLLTHGFFKQVAFLFPFIDQVYIFERDLCQRSIGEIYFNKTWPYHHITELLNHINGQHYDKVVDLSQSETSSRWMTLINAPHKIGVTYNNDRTAKIYSSENPWMRYLHTFSQSKIHFIDLFKKAMDLPLNPLPKISLRQDNNKKRILFQTLSSDVKKNWPVFKWIELFQKIQKEFPDFELIILSSPSEWNQLQQNFAGLGSSVKILNTSIQETYSLLQSSYLLVSLDTAIKHLATWTRTPIIELSLGSSNPDETGAYQEGSMILKSSVPCSPCRHSCSCSQASFVCHENLSVESVFIAMQLQWRLQRQSLENTSFFEKEDSDKIINQFLTDIDNKNLLTPIHYVRSSEDGWWRGEAIQSFRMENQYARRTKNSVAVNY